MVSSLYLSKAKYIQQTIIGRETHNVQYITNTLLAIKHTKCFSLKNINTLLSKGIKNIIMVGRIYNVCANNTSNSGFD